MRVFLSIGAIAVLVLAFYVGRIVLHGFADHGHLDTFHLVVSVFAVALAVALLRRAFRPSASA